jgi:hypothetical protein
MEYRRFMQTVNRVEGKAKVIAELEVMLSVLKRPEVQTANLRINRLEDLTSNPVFKSFILTLDFRETKRK